MHRKAHMHRLRTKSSIYRFRTTALLVCIKCILFPGSIGLLLYSLAIHDEPLTVWAMGLLLLTGLVTILQWLVALRTNCPLCMTPVLASKRCMKHRHAKCFLGSHRLRASIAILLTNSFRCPYCHEPTSLELRDRNR